MTKEAAWVFHRGALGDCVLLWPRLRALALGGYNVTLVTDRSKGALASRELGVDAIDIEHARFHALWRDGAPVETVPGVRLVIDHVSSARSAGDIVRVNLARMFPGASIETSPPPTGADARAMTESCPGAMPAARGNPRGPIVLHVGAGSEDKRWPLDRFLSVSDSLRADGLLVHLIAGEVEAERLSGADRAVFERAGGRFILSLHELADALRAARVFIGSDSGPTHLAAQLGVPTLALFGPTEPAIWAPVGPAARTLAPGHPSSMTWLDPARVASAAREML